MKPNPNLNDRKPNAEFEGARTFLVMRFCRSVRTGKAVRARLDIPLRVWLWTLTGILAADGGLAQSVITVPVGASATFLADLGGNAQLINRGILSSPGIRTRDAASFDNFGDYQGNCVASGNAAIFNSGCMEQVNLNVNGPGASVRNEGSFGGNLTMTDGWFLNSGFAATVPLNVNLGGNARFTNQAVLSANFFTQDSARFDNFGDCQGNFGVYNTAAIFNSGRMEEVNLNADGTGASVRNEGSFGGNLNMTDGWFLNQGTVTTNSNFSFYGTAGFTNNGVSGGTLYVTDQAVVVNRGTVANRFFRLFAGNDDDVKVWSSGTFDDVAIDADTFSPAGTGYIAIDVSGGGNLRVVDLFANTPVPPGSTNPGPSSPIRFLRPAGTNLLHIGSFIANTAGGGSVAISNAPGARLHVDALTASGNTGFRNEGTLGASNLAFQGSTFVQSGTLTASNIAFRLNASFLQSGTAYVASAWFGDHSQSLIHGPTEGGTMQIVATNGSTVNFQNDSLLRCETFHVTVTSPANTGFINVANNGTFDCDELILLDDVSSEASGAFGAEADLITFQNTGTVTGRLFSASTAGLGRVDIFNWGQILSEQFVTNGNVNVFLPAGSIGSNSQIAARPQPLLDVLEPSPCDTATREEESPSPMDAGGDLPDNGFVLVPADAQATFGAALYGTMIVTNLGSYIITNGLRLYEQSSLVNTGTITGDALCLSGQSTVTNAGTVILDQLQFNETPAGTITVCNSGQMHVTELLLSKTGTAVIKCGPSGLFEAYSGWLGLQGIAPFALTNGQSCTLGGVSFVTSGDGIIRVTSGPVRLVNPTLAATNFCFSFDTLTNVTYTVEYNDDLSTTNWQFLESLTGDGSLMLYLVPTTNSTQRFFRLRHPTTDL